MRVGKDKNRKAAGKDEIVGEMVKGGGDRVLDWIWRLCNMAFESGVVPEDWSSTMIVMNVMNDECKNYRGISLLSVAEKNMRGS